jgi:hypothetical protein
MARQHAFSRVKQLPKIYSDVSTPQKTYKNARGASASRAKRHPFFLIGA